MFKLCFILLIFFSLALRPLNTTGAVAERIMLQLSYIHININLMEYVIVICQIPLCLNNGAAVLISLLTYTACNLAGFPCY